LWSLVVVGLAAALQDQHLQAAAAVPVVLELVLDYL
jgi:hypothetical protein